MRENIFTSFTTRLMIGFLFMFSLYILLRGHDYPGGGFIGGLVGAAGVLALYVSRFAGDTSATRMEVGSNFWGYVMFAGISLSLASGLWGLFFGDAFMDAWWYPTKIAGIGKMGTPALFDLGVYMTVIAVIISITRVLANVKNPDDVYMDVEE